MLHSQISQRALERCALALGTIDRNVAVLSFRYHWPL